MEENISIFVARSRRVRGALLMFCAVVLFLAEILLLLAPAMADDSRSRTSTTDFASDGNGWIMGAHSHEPRPLAGS